MLEKKYVYHAYCTIEELNSFIKLFSELEISKFSTIEIKFLVNHKDNESKYIAIYLFENKSKQISIQPLNKSVNKDVKIILISHTDFIQDSFENGLLAINGWTKLFKKQ